MSLKNLKSPYKKRYQFYQFPEDVIENYVKKYITEDYKITNNGKAIYFRSPFMGEIKKNDKSCHIFFESNFVHDFRSELHMSFIQFVSEQEDINQEEAEKLLKKMEEEIEQ